MYTVSKKTGVKCGYLRFVYLQIYIWLNIKDM